MKSLELEWLYKTNDIPIHYTEETNGGGSFFLLDYIDYFKEHYPNKKFNSALEWCAGPGFIGFGILSCDVCNHITFLETYNKAINLLDANDREDFRKFVDTNTSINQCNLLICRSKEQIKKYYLASFINISPIPVFKFSKGVLFRNSQNLPVTS